MSDATHESTVIAAGGVVWRGHGDDRRFAVVHRPHRRDWSLPKGKLEPGEAPFDAAVREVWEETGFNVSVGDPLAEVHYTDHRGRPKTVHYWSMRWESGEFVVNVEVDELSWLSAADAIDRLTYEVDRSLVRQVARQPDR